MFLKKIPLLIIIISLFLPFLSRATSPSLYLSPASGEKEVGEIFDVSVGIDPQGKSVDVFEGTIKLTNFSCQAVSLGSGVMAVTIPSCDNLNFQLGIPGGTIEKRVLFTIKVKGENEGTATISFSGVKILGGGEHLSSSASGGSYLIKRTTPPPPIKYTLQISKTGTGSGVVKNTAINCGLDCSENYDQGTTVILTATPASGSVFKEWKGCDSVTADKCTVKMNTNKVVTATFNLSPQPPQPPQPPLKLPAVTNVTAADVPDDDGKNIKISWDPYPEVDKIDGFFVLGKYPHERVYIWRRPVDKNATSFLDAECTPGKTYDFVVVAYKGRDWGRSIKSPFSNVATATAIDNKKEKPEEVLPWLKFELLTDERGSLPQEVLKKTPDEKLTIKINKETVILDKDFKPAKEIAVSLIPILEIPPEAQKEIPIKDTLYKFGPEKISFSTPIEIVIKYDPINISPGVSESDLVAKMFEGINWVELPTIIDQENNTATVEVKHFTLIGLFPKKIEVPSPPTPIVPPDVPPRAPIRGKLILLTIIVIVIITLITIGVIKYFKKFSEKKKKLFSQEKDLMDKF